MAEIPEKVSFATQNTVFVSSSNEKNENQRNDVSQGQPSEKSSTTDAQATSLEDELANEVTQNEYLLRENEKLKEMKHLAEESRKFETIAEREERESKKAIQMEKYS